MKKYRIGNETFTIEKIHDEYLVTVRDQNDEPFIGADELPFELRIVICSGKDILASIVTFKGPEEVSEPLRDRNYTSIAEALAASGDFISEITTGPFNELVIRLTLRGESAKQLVYDPETIEALDNENVILVVEIFPERRYANFTYNTPEEIPNSTWEELDYDAMIKDLFNLNR